MRFSCFFSRLALSLDKIGCGSAIANKNMRFFLQLRSPCTIFAFMKKIFLIIVLAIMSLPSLVCAQDAVTKHLFEYPVVPDKLTKTNMRANYMVEHFWENCNLEKEEIKDYNALIDAFTDYLSFFVLADRPEVEKSVAKFVERVAKNPANLKSTLAMVDMVIYTPGSEFFSDDVYAIFGRAFASQKKVDSAVKQAYATNIAKAANSKIDAVMGDMSLKRGEETANLNSLTAEYYVVIYNTQGDFDTTMFKLRLDTDIATNNLVKAGKVCIVSVYPSDAAKSGDSALWYTSDNSDFANKYDMRLLPTVYVLDSNRKIISKSPSIENVLNLMAQLGNKLGV